MNTAVRDYPDEVSLQLDSAEVGRLTMKVGNTIPWALTSRLPKNRVERSFICFLTANTM